MACRFALRPALAGALALVLAGCATGGNPAPPQISGVDGELAAFLNEQVAAYQERLADLPDNAAMDVTVAAYDTVIDLTFKYLRDDAAKAAFVAQFTSAVLVKHSCADPKATFWMTKGVVFRFSFRDRDDDLMLRSDVTDGTCAELRTRGETLPS